MSDTVYLRPAEGVKVRRPDGQRLAAAGEMVAKSSFWERRLAAGDVVEGTATAPAAANNNAAKSRSTGNRE